MSDKLRILIVEDVPADAELMQYELQGAGLKCLAHRVETEPAFVSALSEFSPDVILSDYSLPRFDGETALLIARQRVPDTPFIFVTGALGEELAIDLLRKGATDYVLKNRLARLPIAVSRALREVEELKANEQAQAQLRDTQELLKKVATAVEQAAESVMITDKNGYVEYINPAVTGISGYSGSEIVGREYTVLRSDSHDPAFYDAMWRTIKEGTVWKGRLQRRKKDGSVYDAEETISPVKDPSGVIVNYVFLGRDITERLMLEEQLRQAQKMEAIGTLAGGIAHDFNNVLAGIIGFTEMVMEDVPPDSPEYRRLKLALKGANRGRDLVKQILAFSRQTGHDRKSLALSHIIEEALKLLRPALPSTIEIVWKSLTNHDEILADPVHMHQILMNLCTNAAHAMRQEGGVLDISLSRIVIAEGNPAPVPEMVPGEYLGLEVRDTGSGMTPQTLKRIFDPFFSTKKGEGTGLGLSVVHGIVKSYDGYITVESEPGKGSAFRVYLPKPRVLVRTEPEKTASFTGGNERILLVDDEDILVELSKQRLTRFGYRVEATTGSMDALAIFRKDPDGFDLVITDHTMPGMTGMDLAVELLKIRTAIPIILCTGYSETVSQERASRIGIKGFLMKPIAKEELAQAIRRALDGDPLPISTK